MKTLPRSFYVPKDRPVRVATYADIPAQIARYDGAGKPVVIGWRGRAQKPTFHYSFKSPADAERYVSNWLAREREIAARNNAQRAAKNGRHSLRVGQVLVRSWGYDQTNVDYYQVTAKIGKTMVEVRPIGSVFVGERGGPSERVAPHVDHFTGEPKRCRPSADNAVKINHYDHAYPWDGESRHQTGFGWGH